MKINRIFGVFFIVFFCSTFVVGQTTFTISDTTVIVGDNILVPVVIDLDTSDDVLGVHLNINYEAENIEFVRLVKNGSLSENITSAVNARGDSILISLASVNPMVESGELIFLEFTALTVGTSDIRIAEYRINEEAMIFPENAVANIKIFGEGGNQPPFVVQIPDTLSFFSGDTLTLMVDETLFADVEDEFTNLSLSFTIDPVVVIPIFIPETNELTVTTLDYVGFATLNVRVEDLDGGILEFDIVLDIQLKVSNEETGAAPTNFVLNQNYPNPFNPSTNISYQIPRSGEILLEVFATNGQKVATLVDGVQVAGSHTVRFDASGLSSGIYLYRISSSGFTTTKKMLLIK